LKLKLHRSSGAQVITHRKASRIEVSAEIYSFNQTNIDFLLKLAVDDKGMSFKYKECPVLTGDINCAAFHRERILA